MEGELEALYLLGLLGRLQRRFVPGGPAKGDWTISRNFYRGRMPMFLSWMTMSSMV